MKNTLLISFIVTVFLLIVSEASARGPREGQGFEKANAGQSNFPECKGPGGPQGPCGGPKGRMSKREVLERFDADGDGELNEGERQAAKDFKESKKAEMKEKMIERFDADGDGELNKEERQAAKKEMQKRHKGKGKGPQGGKDKMRAMKEKFDSDGDGKLNEEERQAAKEFMESKKAEMKEKMIERFDADGDGELNKEERQTARKEMQKRHKGKGKKKGKKNKEEE